VPVLRPAEWRTPRVARPHRRRPRRRLNGCPALGGARLQGQDGGNRIPTRAHGRGPRGCIAQVTALATLCDVGVWPSNTLAGRRPAHVVEVLDFCHAREHPWKLVLSLWGESSARAAAWVADQKKRLLEGQEDALAREPELCAQKGHAWSEEGEKQLACFTTNRDRIHHKQCPDSGYPVGSGAVEAACKTVVCMREKQPGMRWRRTTAEAIAHPRAVCRSSRWHSLL